MPTMCRRSLSPPEGGASGASSPGDVSSSGVARSETGEGAGFLRRLALAPAGGASVVDGPQLERQRDAAPSVLAADTGQPRFEVVRTLPNPEGAEAGIPALIHGHEVAVGERVRAAQPGDELLEGNRRHGIR